MARSDKRYMVYPAPRAVEIFGSTSPSLNQALECWAALLARATADNSSKNLSYYPEGGHVGHITGKFEDYHSLHPWGLLAEVLENMRFDPEFANPGELLATAVEDAHRLENVAQKWFSSEFDMDKYAQGLEATVKDLITTLRSLDYIHAWAVIVAVQWYREHQHEGIDKRKDQWWTLTFRRQWKPKKAATESSHSDARHPIRRKKPKTEKRK